MQAPQDLSAGSERRWYRSSGLTIASYLALDELAAPCAPGDADLVIEECSRLEADRFTRASEHVLAVGEVGSPWLEVRRGEGAYLARWPEQMDVIIPDSGTQMLVHMRGEVPDSIARLLLCPAMSFVLAAHSAEGLHASAVEIDGRAVVVAGQSGRGKSTTATALCMAGGRLIADDLVCLRLLDGTIVVEPTTTRTWMAEELANAVAGGSSREASQRLNKVSVDSLELAPDAIPLAAVFVLGYRANAIEISEPIDQKTAMTEVLAASFNYAIKSPARMAAQFDLVTKIATEIPVRTLRWDPHPEAARDVAAQIIALVTAPKETEMVDSQINGSARANGTLRREVIEQLRAAGIDYRPFEDGDEPLLRTSQVAALLRSSDRTIRTWADAGKLPYIKTLGGRRLFPVSGVMAVLQKMRGTRVEEV